MPEVHSCGLGGGSFRGGQARGEHHPAAYRGITPPRTTSGGGLVGHEVRAPGRSVSHREDRHRLSRDTRAGEETSSRGTRVRYSGAGR